MRKKKGIITSAKMTGTVTVTVHRHAFHPKYRKRFRISKKFLADAGEHTLREGDMVMIGECRPLSKNKHFQVLEVLKRAADVSELVEEEGVEKAIHREKKAPEQKTKIEKKASKPAA